MSVLRLEDGVAGTGPQCVSCGWKMAWQRLDHSECLASGRWCGRGWTTVSGLQLEDGVAGIGGLSQFHKYHMTQNIWVFISSLHIQTFTMLYSQHD